MYNWSIFGWRILPWRNKDYPSIQRKNGSEWRPRFVSISSFLLVGSKYDIVFAAGSLLFYEIWAKHEQHVIL